MAPSNVWGRRSMWVTRAAWERAAPKLPGGDMDEGAGRSARAMPTSAALLELAERARSAVLMRSAVFWRWAGRRPEPHGNAVALGLRAHSVLSAVAPNDA